MSSYNERYDAALGKMPWVSKEYDERTYLFMLIMAMRVPAIYNDKYAPHPDRAGYLFIATDLQTVAFEELSTTSFPTRLAHIASLDGGTDDEILALGYNELQARTNDAMKSLAAVFDGNWAKATVERDMDDYFDAVFVITSGSFKWVFQMTELRGRQPLVFISKHLLLPWSALIGQDRGVSVDSANPVEAVGAIISDPGVSRALRRITGAGPPRPTPTPGLPMRRSTPAADPVGDDSRLGIPQTRRATSPPEKRTPSRHVMTPEPERTPLPRPATPERTAQAALSLIPPSSPTPMTRRKVYDFAAGVLPSSDYPEDSDMGEILGSHGGGTAHDSSTPTVRASGQQSPLASSPPAPPSGLPSSDARIASSDASSMPTSSMIPSSTLDPLLPTLEGKTKTKRKNAKKNEEEEEAEANKRREEMKRRMAGGGGTGRLGRRRA